MPTMVALETDGTVLGSTITSAITEGCKNVVTGATEGITAVLPFVLDCGKLLLRIHREMLVARIDIREQIHLLNVPLSIFNDTADQSTGFIWQPLLAMPQNLLVICFCHD